MAQKTIKGSEMLAGKMKLRRNELNLTIQEVAIRAGVGTKTWSRYEAGESIRKDKCKGICRALNWRDFPDNKSAGNKRSLNEEYKSYEAWSQFLENNFGARAAMSFAVGSDILLDFIEQDLSDLASMPLGSHIGQLSTSFIKDDLPSQFMMRYDYDFLYQMRCSLRCLRMKAKMRSPMTAHSVLDELVIYLCNEEAKGLIELSEGVDELDDDDEPEDLEGWVFDLFDDMDVITFMYSDENLSEEHPFHFVHWNDQQFYMDSAE